MLERRAVGVISGRGSDGIDDVIAALQDRFPPVMIITCPAIVQGRRAPLEIIDALARLQEHPLVDVIVIARGGGSVQDLIAFDDERLCRAIFACSKPVVAAIGHTSNVPVCNHVAHSAHTPSRSHELIVPAISELRQQLEFSRQRLAALPSRLSREAKLAEALAARLDAGARVSARAGAVRYHAQALETTEQEFFAACRRTVTEARAALSSIERRLPPLSQIAALGAGRDSRATSFFAACERELAGQGQRLASAPQRLTSARSAVGEQCRRLGVGTRRQLEDHRRDYGRALARLTRETSTAALRRLRQKAERLGDNSSRLGERAGRQLGDAERNLRIAATAVEARDFRRHGYVLAADERGQPVRSVSGLARGDNLNLTFTDGQARAVINDIKGDKRQ